jgi:hypothetical protein
MEMTTDVGAKKRAGIVLIILSILLLVLVLLPSNTGGAGGGFGPLRLLGLAFGLLIAFLGFALTRKKGHTAEPPE